MISFLKDNGNKDIQEAYKKRREKKDYYINIDDATEFSVLKSDLFSKHKNESAYGTIGMTANYWYLCDYFGDSSFKARAQIEINGNEDFIRAFENEIRNETFRSTEDFSRRFEAFKAAQGKHYNGGVDAEIRITADGNAGMDISKFQEESVPQSSRNNGQSSGNNANSGLEGIQAAIGEFDSIYSDAPAVQRECEEIKAKAIANGTFMKAPNGKQSKLDERQWLHVRTKAFKEWFGDWERLAELENLLNSEKNSTPSQSIESLQKEYDELKGKVSKAVNKDTLEPELYYHTVDINTWFEGKENFKVFDRSKSDKGGMFYFTNNQEMSNSYFHYSHPIKNASKDIKEKQKSLYFANLAKSAADTGLDGITYTYETLNRKLPELTNDIKSKLEKMSREEFSNAFPSSLLGFNTLDERAIVLRKFREEKDTIFPENHYKKLDDIAIKYLSIKYYYNLEYERQYNETKKAIDEASFELNKGNSPIRAFFLNIQTPTIYEGNGNIWNNIKLSENDRKYLNNLAKRLENIREIKVKTFAERYIGLKDDIYYKSNNTEEIIDIIKNYKGGDGNVRLLIKELLEKDLEISKQIEDLQDYAKIDKGVKTRTLEKLSEYDHTADSVYMKNIIDYGSDRDILTPGDVIAVKNPNQIKSATDNNGQYSRYDDNIEHYKTSRGEIYAFVDKKGDMYIDETKISPEHLVHEYTHLWDRAVQQRNLELWNKGVKLMKQLSLWQEILCESRSPESLVC